MESFESEAYPSSNHRMPSPGSTRRDHGFYDYHKQQQHLHGQTHRHKQPQPSPKQQRHPNNHKHRQHQPQQQQHRHHHSSEQPVTLHIRSHPSPPVRSKHRHNEKVQHSPHRQREEHNRQQPHQHQHYQKQQQPQPPRKLHLHLHHQTTQPLLLSTSKKSTPEVSPSHVVTSQPGIPTGKQQSAGNSNPTGKSPKSRRKDPNNVKNEATTNPRQLVHYGNQSNRNTAASPRQGKPSKYCVAASETETPRRFGGDDPDKKPGKKPDTHMEKHHNPDFPAIPQTNLSVGLIVFCCFNPVFGAFAIYLSLAAARAYRDGHDTRGSSRAHWSILVSLFGITVTMVVVSSLVVMFSVGKHTNSHYKRMASQALGL